MTITTYNWSNTTNLGDIVINAPNANTHGAFWVTALYFLWLLGTLLLTVFGWEVALMVASFSATIVGVMLVYAGAIAWMWLIPFVGIDLFMFLYIVWSAR